jgi:hypothetical protein
MKINDLRPLTRQDRYAHALLEQLIEINKRLEKIEKSLKPADLPNEESVKNKTKKTKKKATS